MRWDFSAIMVVFVVVSGAIWAIDAWFFAPRRRLALATGGESSSAPRAEPAESHSPILVEYARSFFPVFLIVLLLRSFLIEPFRIPSNSMMPTLLTGDFIVVNKFAYGIRLPVTDQKVLEIGSPERGDVVVFRYPNDPSTPFIKRVIGLPGDRVAYQNRTVFINGQRAEQEQTGIYEGFGSGLGMTGASRRTETLGDVDHSILVLSQLPSESDGEWVVPPGHYFVLGDNRDNSRDSRFWGFVPDKNLIGKAFTIWLNWDWGHGLDWGRVGMSID